MISKSFSAVLLGLAVIVSGCASPFVKQYLSRPITNKSALQAKDLCTIYVIPKVRAGPLRFVTFDGDNLVGIYSGRKNLCWDRASGRLDLCVALVLSTFTETELDAYKATGKGKGEFTALHAHRGKDNKPVFVTMNLQTEPGKSYYVLETTEVIHSVSAWFVGTFDYTLGLELVDEGTAQKYLK